MFTTTVAFSLFLLQCVFSTLGSEPACSRFHYEAQTLEKMIRQEIAVETMKSEMEDIHRKVDATLTDIGIEKDKIVVDLEKKNHVAFEKMEISMENTITEIKTRNDENVKAYSEQMEKVKASVTTPLVAFKARKATDKTVSDNKVVVFTENLMNLGDAYNNKTGIFVAPVTGLYIFTALICVGSKRSTYFGIFIDDRQLTFSHVGDYNLGTCSSFDAITTLDEGDQVTVKCALSCDSTDYLWENSYHVTNSFSGVLLHKLTVNVKSV